MQNSCLCENTLINVNKIVIKNSNKEKYLKFSKKLDKELKEKYSKYYICDQINQSTEYEDIFFVAAFYNNIGGIYDAIKKITEFIKDSYKKEFGNSIKRIDITNFANNKKIYPK